MFFFLDNYFGKFIENYEETNINHMKLTNNTPTTVIKTIADVKSS